MLIPKKIFPIAGFCAKEDFRYAISRVQLRREDGKAIAFATDGKILCKATWTEEENYPEIGLDQSRNDAFDVKIGIETWKSIEKAIPRSRFKQTLENALIE